MSLTTPQFEFFRDFIKARSSIVIEPGKEYMVESRLTPLLKTEKLASLDEMMSKLKFDKLLDQKIVDAMTTNETYFFRDIHPFDALKTKIIPELIAKRQSEKKLTIWCAACSSGQEPYSIAMIIREYFPQLKDWQVKIIATDLSMDILNKAREAQYNQLEVNRGLSALLLVKYFTKVGMHWKLKEDLVKMIDFRVLNLNSTFYPIPSPDIVFLRNVLIYFDVPTKKNIFENVKKILRPDGYLFIGASETTLNVYDGFERVVVDKATCFQPKK